MKSIEVIGLGAGDLEQLPLGIYRKLISAEQTIYVRTSKHPVVEALRKEGVRIHSFDPVYETATDFQTVYENIVQQLLKLAEKEAVIYAVPGHPMLAERTVQMLLQQNDVQVTISGGHSYLDDLFTALRIDPIEGFQFLDATSFKREDISYKQHIVFCQVYDPLIASQLKLTLMEDLPHDYEIAIVEAAGTKQEKIRRIPLIDLDRNMNVSNLTSVYVPPAPEELLRHQFSALRNVIRKLRGPDGCPWDRKQTHESLRRYAIEEVYELIDAIDRGDDEAIVEELGDVLLQVMLHGQIGEDNGYFSIDDVIQSTVEKMIHRHPHVFNKNGPQKTWEELKREERGQQEGALLDSVIIHGPSLHVAEKMQKKAAKVGFDWDDRADVWEKLHEEINEFLEAAEENEREDMEEEFGDILFMMANIARFYNIEPELALRKANEKFRRRFTELERIVKKRNLSWDELTLSEMDEMWEEVKRKEQ